MSCPNGKNWCPGPAGQGRKCLACERDASNAAVPPKTAVLLVTPKPATPNPPPAPKTSTGVVGALPRQSPLKQPVTPPLGVVTPAPVKAAAVVTPPPVVVVGLRGGGVQASPDAKRRFREDLSRLATWKDNVTAMEQRIVANAKEFGTTTPAEWGTLDEEEKVAIWMYTKQYFRFWNTALYTDNKQSLTKYAAAIELFKCGLAKLARYDGPLYRGENTYEARHDGHVNGAKFTIKAFWSTTRDEDLLKSAGQFGGEVKYIVANGHDGRLVEFVSESAKEKEVLFLPNAAFEVTNRSGDRKKRQTIEISVRQST